MYNFRDHTITDNEYDKVTKEITPNQSPVITEEDVEDMKQRLATFEYLLRYVDCLVELNYCLLGSLNNQIFPLGFMCK